MAWRKCRFLLALAFVAGTAYGEEKKESGGEHAASPGKAVELTKDEKDFFEKSSKLTTLTNRIAESERQFIGLVRAKDAAQTPQEKQDVMKQMVALTKDRNKDVENFTKIKAELLYRYPNQGTRLNRQYHTHEKRTMEELEGVAGLDELLTQTKKIVAKKFASFKNKDATPDQGEVVEAPRPTEVEKPKRLKLEK